MIGLVLIGHNRIASEMKAAVEHVVGEQPLMLALDVEADAPIEMLGEKLRAMLRAADVGDGVLLLADMFGGTPCNIAMGCLEPGRVEVISGFNLPLLIKAATLRSQEADLAALAEQVVQSGRHYMCRASTMIAEGKQGCSAASEDRAGG